MIKVAQIAVHEGDEPDFIAHLLNPHVLSGEHLTEVDLSLVEADAGALGDGDGAIVKRVVKFAQTAIARGEG